jgi:hypothetical protein
VLVAYVVNPALAMPLVPATRLRAWMEATDNRFANRCLPLLMANQAGWFLLSAHTARLTWNGRQGRDAITVEHLGGTPPHPAVSHFGHGVVTWNVPYLFRTPPGYNLLVRGPANWPKDGACPLEGLVETDWSPATFTVNWLLTRPGRPVLFEEGEPICMLLPQRRGELESFAPELRPVASDPATASQYERWAASRAEFNAALAVPGSDAARQRWQKHYFQGLSGDGQADSRHQTKMVLRDFTPAGTPGAPQPAPAAAPTSPAADAILRDLLVVEGFADERACARLVDLHRRRGTLSAQSDNAYPLLDAREQDPETFALARDIVGRLAALIHERFGAGARCDLSLIAALTRRGYRHSLHADNALVACPRHGTDAETLRRLGCRCPDVEVRPNHTPWRRFSALLYLSGQHRGGDIVFGEGPNVYGGVYRKQIQPRPGLLVLSPSNELYFHYTTPVTSGVRYSMNSWFTDDDAHADAGWM